jgi:hypothetical protein
MAPAVLKPVAGVATGLAGVLLALVVAISTGEGAWRRAAGPGASWVRLAGPRATDRPQLAIHACLGLHFYSLSHCFGRRGAVLAQRSLAGQQQQHNSRCVPTTCGSLWPCYLSGNLRVPLPAPGHNNYVNVVAPGVLPWTPQPLKVCAGVCQRSAAAAWQGS